MLTWCFFVLFVFGENRQPLLSLAKLRLEEVWKSFTEHTKRVAVWLKNDSEKGP